MARVAKTASTSILRCGFHTKVDGLDFAMQLPKDWSKKYRFAFVRNPFDRLVSAWQMFQRYPTGNGVAFDNRTLTLAKVLDVIEDESISIYNKNYWGKLKLHAVPITHPHYRIEEVDFLGKFENLEEDWKALCQSLSMPHQPLGRLRESGRSEHHSKFFNHEIRERCERIFAKDMVKFGYRFNEQTKSRPKLASIKPSPTFLFLCGVGQSGTTVLRNGLGVHNQIYYNGFENNLVQDIANVALKNCSLKSRKNAMVVNQSQYDAAFRDLLRSLIWPDVKQSQRPVHMAAINPTPDQLNYLLKLFPNSKYIGLVRNGIEVVSSRMEFRSFAENDFATHCDTWNRSAQVVRWGRKNSDDFKLIRHEWLYAPVKLKQWMQELTDWLAIEPSALPASKILETLQHPTSAVSSIDRQKFSKSTIEDKRNYFLSKRNRWRKWSPQQLAQFQDRCGPAMQTLNYNLPWQQLPDNHSATG